MTFIEHGGRLAAARARFPKAPEPWLDLSTGISPWPYPIPALSVECWSRLPDSADVERLSAAARTAYRAPLAAHVSPVPGTDIAINLLARLVREPQDVAIVSPTYGTHEIAWRAAGHRVRRVAEPADIGAAGVGIVVNPNNPDGRAWSSQELRETASRLAKGGGVLIVDEAFGDVASNSLLAPTANLSNIVVLRSFGKFFGLAGVRLGFVITAHGLGESLKVAANDWAVSGPAITIGRQALADEAWIGDAKTRLVKAAARLDGVLQVAGLGVTGGTPLFRTIAISDPLALFVRLAERGILARPFSNQPVLRFGIPGRDEDFIRLQAALAR